ncbi:hypothetical protein GALL_96080 [mine drainage metagenome]|uniref:Uncharacterized protein n=1 Tax=mine drainage metagenome TaxID=410659 RepID=A0A1J5SVQ7_9ZZZZ
MIPPRSLFRCAFVLIAVPVFAKAADRAVLLDAPAQRFTESTPLGNGRLGAMMFGGVADERIVLNESGMWSGSPQDADRPDAVAALPEIRRLLLAGRNVAAEKLVNQKFTCLGAGSGRGNGAKIPYGDYQVLGNLHLRFTGPDASSPFSHYRRVLDLARAEGFVSYEQGGVTYSRVGFVSAPDQVFVLRLTASRAASLSFDVTLDRPERATTRALDARTLEMSGALSNGRGGDGVRFASCVRVLAQGGTVNASGAGIRVRGADAVVLLVSGDTDIAHRSFAGRTVGDVVRAALHDVDAADKKTFASLEAAHEADYRSWFDRVSLELGPGNRREESLPTPERLTNFAAGVPDPGLPALYFDFGRYLLISSSRPGGLPANLQGIWADGIHTPWNGDWHLNINVEMNYWLSDVADLGPLEQPLFALIRSLTIPGARTARDYYGARGWVAHVITNPWGFTSPAESASWGSTCTGSAWLCTHLWEHYLFTGDRDFLRSAYPILKVSAEFYEDMLIEEPTHHWLVTAPSNSPENSFRLPDGRIAHICLGATMDEQLIRALFAETADAARILGVDTTFRRELDAKRARLAPTRISPDGRVMEWLYNYAEVDPHHRHVSHLWGLFPGHEIDPATMPALAAAARRTLEVRGDAGTGWGTAYKLGMWARLGDGEHAYKLLRDHLAPARPASKPGVWTGGLYPNLFGAHPPFQIDGNLGGPAVILEMLVQSRAAELIAHGAGLVDGTTGGPDAEIDLLPALPRAWPEGNVRGVRARGDFAVDFHWAAGRLISATIHNAGAHRATVRVRCQGASWLLTIDPGRSARVAPGTPAR